MPAGFRKFEHCLSYAEVDLKNDNFQFVSTGNGLLDYRIHPVRCLDHGSDFFGRFKSQVGGLWGESVWSIKLKKGGPEIIKWTVKRKQNLLPLGMKVIWTDCPVSHDGSP